MWKLTHIQAQELCAFRLLEYTPRQGVATLIFGENRDNDSQGSNGAGKSSLLEAIAVGITGSPLRKARAEEIIRDDADTCRVCLEFENDESDECFTVERRIARKGPSAVVCRIGRRGSGQEPDTLVQPSVDAYNRYILETLGISREELYSNFLLSKYRYAEFLAAPDNKKKEIINAFSGAGMVDGALESLEEDCKPLEEELRRRELEMAGIDGRIAVVEEQILTEESSEALRQQRREEQRTAITERIAQKRALQRHCDEQMQELQLLDRHLVKAEALLREAENSDRTLEACIEHIVREVQPLLHGTLEHWRELPRRKAAELARLQQSLRAYQRDIAAAQDAVEAVLRRHDTAARELRAHQQASDTQREEIRQKLEALAAELETLDGRIRELGRQRQQLAANAAALRAKLAGAIACPACGHEFIMADHGFDIAHARSELARAEERDRQIERQLAASRDMRLRIESDEAGLRREGRAAAQRLQQAQEHFMAAESELRKARGAVLRAEHDHEQCAARIEALQSDVEGLRRKFFDEVFSLADDAARRRKRRDEALQEERQGAEQALGVLQQTLRELDETAPQDLARSLRRKLAEYRRNAAEVLALKEELERRIARLREQQQHFIQFKTYLANSKIEALGHLTNQFLERIGSDIRIRFQGYTQLRTGKVREKISVTLLRNGVDGGSFGKFSAGEAARVNLATILAMQKLVNANCPDTRGLDLLVLDEILEAVDEEGLSAMFAALNKLGITALVVSHGNIAEAYPHKVVVVKQGGVASIA